MVQTMSTQLIELAKAEAMQAFTAKWNERLPSPMRVHSLNGFSSGWDAALAHASLLNQISNTHRNEPALPEQEAIEMDFSAYDIDAALVAAAERIADQDAKQLAAKARIIRELEARLSSALERESRRETNPSYGPQETIEIRAIRDELQRITEMN